MIRFQNEQDASRAIMEALRGGDESKIKQAWDGFHQSVVQQVLNDMEDYQQSHDENVLMQRGYRQLTSAEKRFYQRLGDAMKSSNPRQVFDTFIKSDTGADDSEIMPETIIEDVYRNLQENHPLLSRIDFQYVGYVTKWIVNDHTAVNAVWGKITDAISKEITSGFRVINVHQNKLSAYAFIERAMLELGPTFLDGYIRTVLTEALASGLEYGVVMGSGLNEPTGLIRDIHEGVSFSSSTGYPEKSTGNGKYTATSFAPAEYGSLISNLVKTENGHVRNLTSVSLICNQIDYLTKIMPATTVLNANGTYVNNLFPFPTEVIISNALETGEIIIANLPEYHAFTGGDRNGTIEFSDEFKFLDDTRYFKIVQYATGQAFDNTSAILVDISGLEPAYITVKNEGTTNVAGTISTNATVVAPIPTV